MRAFVEALPGAAVVLKPEWSCETFQVLGKHFGRVNYHPSGARLLTIKGDPEDNAALAQQYEAVTPGYYANKRLWISVALDGSDVPRDLTEEFIETAYMLVRASLPKREQAKLGDAPR